MPSGNAQFSHFETGRFVLATRNSFDERGKSEGPNDWGAFLFGYFFLGTQEKVTR
ncbi:MAG: hypothetical protein OQJ95_06745 [Kangiella sp.]|nr:hypothetical protein [Kangiella sp.]